MTATSPAGDRVSAALRVDVPQADAFRIFTEEIDAWWRQGRKYRVGGAGRSVLHLEAGVGGRLFESIRASDGAEAHVVQTGEVIDWSPPAGFALRWRGVNFAADEATTITVTFAAQGDEATLVTVVHAGWASLPDDHPVRHGQPVPAFIRGMAMWWGDLLNGLRRHVAERG